TGSVTSWLPPARAAGACQCGGDVLSLHAADIRLSYGCIGERGFEYRGEYAAFGSAEIQAFMLVLIVFQRIRKLCQRAAPGDGFQTVGIQRQITLACRIGPLLETLRVHGSGREALGVEAVAAVHGVFA